MTSEDNATQGWETYPMLSEIGMSFLLSPEGTKYEMATKDADLILAALQRPGREAALVEALRKINQIRNRIVGYQNINWSRDIYPLVAALKEAGIEGMSYDEARANVEAELKQFQGGDLTYRDWPLISPLG